MSDHTKPFEVHTDALDFAIRGVLIQDGHPVALQSRKLNNTERWDTVQENEMTAVVHCYAEMGDPNRGESTRASTSITALFDKEVDTILAHRVMSKRGTRHLEYLVKWKGQPDSKANWEHEESLWQFVDKIAKFREAVTRASPV